MKRMSLARAIAEGPQRDAEIVAAAAATGRTVDSVLAEVCARCADGASSVQAAIAAIMPPPMLALTLWQPWATAVVLHGKPIENRTWPPGAVIGKTIAIHAGKRWDQEAADWIANTMGIRIARHTAPLMALVGTARVARAFQRSEGDVYGTPPDVLAANAWAFGPWCWVLDQVRAVTPLPAKGRQGLWRVPAELALQLAA